MAWKPIKAYLTGANTELGEMWTHTTVIPIKLSFIYNFTPTSPPAEFGEVNPMSKFMSSIYSLSQI